MQLQEIATKPTDEFRKLPIEEATRLLLSSKFGLTDAEVRARTEKSRIQRAEGKSEKSNHRFCLAAMGASAVASGTDNCSFACNRALSRGSA